MRDRDVRAAVRQRLDADHAGDVDTRIVEEMGVWSGSVRIDIAVINGQLTGYELKSDRDTLDRLPLQAEIYSRVFDSLTLVVGKRHAIHARKLVPRWWGITIAHFENGLVELEEKRGAKTNPSPDPLLVAELLSKDEALSVLDELQLAAGWRGRKIREIHQRLVSALAFEELSSQVRARLKSRQGWLRQKSSGDLDVAIDAEGNPAWQTPLPS